MRKFLVYNSQRELVGAIERESELRHPRYQMMGELELEAVYPEEQVRQLLDKAQAGTEHAHVRFMARAYEWLRDIGDATWTPLAKRVGCSAEAVDQHIADQLAVLDKSKTLG